MFARLIHRSTNPRLHVLRKPKVQRQAAISRPTPCYRPTNRAIIHSRGRRRTTAVCAAGGARSLYELLGVSETASAKEIKSAFRKKALKIHPDVNKAPDATQRFMEAKMAFQTLSDEKSRADYDKRLRMGFGASRDWSSGSASDTKTYKTNFRRRPKPEDNYSFEDFMRDLDKEVASWARERSSGGRPQQQQPMSLFDELASIGEEFVEFLEDSLGIKDESPSGSQSTSSSRSQTEGRPEKASDYGSNPIEAFDNLMKKYGNLADDGGPASSYKTQGSSSSSSTSSSSFTSSSSSVNNESKGGGSQQSRKKREDELDAQLAELKRKVGRKK